MTAETRTGRTSHRKQQQKKVKKPGRGRGKQEELFARGWGGMRSGSGRKRRDERPQVPHRRRPPHQASKPVLVTARLVGGLGSLRQRAELRLIEAALEEGSAQGSFHVVHHSVQSNHLHLIVEARDRRSLTEGLRGLWIRIARRLNAHWGRRGPVFSGRYHERALATPREVRNALVYVLQNSRKHGIAFRGPDPFTSGDRFDGWAIPPFQVLAGSRGVCGEAAKEEASTHAPATLAGRARIDFRTLERTRVILPPWKDVSADSSSPAMARRASSWLLSIGWKRHGLIRHNEAPR